MNREKEISYKMISDVENLNEDNLLKPYMYQRLFAQLADRHLEAIGEDIGKSMQFNLAWALVSVSVEIVKPVAGIAEFSATTWHSQRRGPYFRREFVFKDEKGELAFHGASYSILLDVVNRTVYRKKELPFDIVEPIEEYAVDTSPNMRNIHISGEYDKIDERRVYSSYIDRLGHVNNCRYGEFGYDALSDEERSRLSDLKRMDIYFTSELRRNDSFSVLKAVDGNKVLVRGYNESRSENSFDIIYHF